MPTKNQDKPIVMILGSAGKLRVIESDSLSPIVINGVLLPYVNSNECLSVTISNNLSWKNHVSEIWK